MTEAERQLVAEQDEAWGNAAPTDAEMERMWEVMGQSTAPELTDDDLNSNYVFRRSVRGSR